MKEGESLDQLASDILFLLWRRQWDGDRNLVTPADLHKALLKDGYPTTLKLRSVKRSLDWLKNHTLVESAPIPRPENHSGPAPSGYRLAPDAPLITRRSTAQIVVILHHHQRRLVAEQAFIAETLETEDLRRDDTGQALTPEDLRNQLLWCIGKGYIKVCGDATDPEDPGGQRPLCTTCKVHGELLFLERICGRKGPSSAIRAIRVYEGAAAG
jgi:hypothetical protein